MIANYMRNHLPHKTICISGDAYEKLQELAERMTQKYAIPPVPLSHAAAASIRFFLRCSKSPDDLIEAIDDHLDKQGLPQ